MTKRMYCTGEGPTFRYVMAVSKAVAEGEFGAKARTPDPDDLRKVWVDNRLETKTPEEIRTMFGISRQALSMWRQKAGADLPNARQHRNEQKRYAILAALDPEKSAAQIAKELHVTLYDVKTIAEEAGIELAVLNRKKPEDDEIVRLSEGKTWRELAEACNVALPTLQHYVYARPALAERVRKGIVREPSGADAHGRVDVEELIRRVEAGDSNYSIAQHFKVQPINITYWRNKLGL